MRHFSPALSALLLFAAADDAAAQCEQQKLLASDKSGGDNFGQSVAISGSVIVSGAHFNTDLGPLTGSAYVYELVGATWTQTAKLLSSDIAQNDRFGFSVDVDDGTIVVSTRYNDDFGYGTGSIYVFEKHSGAWVETQKLLPSDPQFNKFFGVSVAISGDVIVVGADLDDQVATDAGAAYVFERQTSGSWIEVAKLIAADAAMDDRFGAEVAVDGDRLVVSAHGDDDNGAQSGSAYVFSRQSSGAWTQTAKLMANDGATTDRFGNSVAIDQDTVAVGALKADGNQVDSGAVYIFERTGTSWTQTTKLVDASGLNLDQLGSEVAVEGEVVVVGAWSAEETPIDAASGQILTFRKVGNQWHQATKVQASDKKANDALGWSVSISGGVIVSGARGVQSGAGAAYVFDHFTNSYLVGAGCGGPQVPAPVLELKGCIAPLGQMELLLSGLQTSAPGLLILGGTVTAAPINPVCTLYAGPPHFGFILLPAPNSSRMSLPSVLPAASSGVSIAVQYFQADAALPLGYRTSNGASLVVP